MTAKRLTWLVVMAQINPCDYELYFPQNVCNYIMAQRKKQIKILSSRTAKNLCLIRFLIEKNQNKLNNRNEFSSPQKKFF